MKKTFIIVIILILSVLVGLNCQKEEVEVKTVQNEGIDTTSIEELNLRNGGDIIFYRTSLTTDNYLITNNVNIFRTYNIFNKVKIINIEMKASDQGDINVNGVILKHYKVQINFIDSTNYSFTAYSKTNGNQFTFTPYGDNILRDQHTAKFIEIKSSPRSSSEPIYGFWRDQMITPQIWTISKNGTDVMSVRILEPLDKNSNIFRPQTLH